MIDEVIRLVCLKRDREIGQKERVARFLVRHFSTDSPNFSVAVRYSK